jgi:transglutaminase-like putative cysteine protease
MEAIREASNSHGIVDAITRKVQARLSPVDHEVTLLRSTALDSWVDGEGQCGDAARVIVLMLRSVGIDAGRVYLRAEPENYFHVAVAYHVGGRAYLVDTVNSTSEFRRFVETHRRRALDEIEMPNSQFYSHRR